MVALMRKKILEDAERLPASVRPYGIGITAAKPEVAPEHSDGSIAYHYEIPAGLRVLSWADAVNTEDIAETLSVQVNEKNIPVFADRNFAESLARFGDGLVVIAEKGSTAAFEFSSMFEKSGSDLIVVLVEDDAVLRILENVKSKHSVSAGKNIFAVVGKNASLTYSSISELSNGSSAFIHKISRVYSNGKMEWYDLTADSSMFRSLTEDTLAENGAESYSYHLSLCTDEHFDIYNKARHEADNTVSHIFARGIAGGGGKIVYRALSDIRSGVIGATGRQDGRFLITSSGAEVDAIPSLDIASSESNSSHALSISHLTDKDFFYPALRGIAPYRAQAMLLSGFLAKPLEKLPESWQAKFLEKINKKLSSPVFRMGEKI